MTHKKGQDTEELLRNYFIGLGFFVVRGASLMHGSTEVTDVDLWVYGKSSPFCRKRINVDIKDKKSAKAMERIPWAKGIASILGLESCIVSTSDKRPEVRSFGEANGVKVLDGHFLSRLKAKEEKEDSNRISEEDFLDLVGNLLSSDCREMYAISKSRLISSISFDACNLWLQEIKDGFLLRSKHSDIDEVSRRFIYAVASHLVIGFDFILSRYIDLERKDRAKVIDEGIRYGSSGMEMVGKVSSIIRALGNSFPVAGAESTLLNAIDEEISDVQSEVLAETFSCHKLQRQLFDVAKELEAAAFSLEPIRPGSLDTTTQSVLGILADFSKVDRRLALA